MRKPHWFEQVTVERMFVLVDKFADFNGKSDKVLDRPE